MDSSTLLWGILYGSIGMGYFVYGKKQQRILALLSGVGLMVFPYFVSNVWLSIVIGIALMALPFFIQY
jgi:hypothetical protein